jgi:aspartyl-tRNA synthetase
MGWVQKRRDLGQLIFIDLRDRAGIVQIVFNKEQAAQAHAKAEELRSEFVVAVEGRVVRRQKANPEIPTGEVEVLASRLYILNNSKTPGWIGIFRSASASATRIFAPIASWSLLSLIWRCHSRARRIFSMRSSASWSAFARSSE